MPFGVGLESMSGKTFGLSIRSHGARDLFNIAKLPAVLQPYIHLNYTLGSYISI